MPPQKTPNTRHLLDSLGRRNRKHPDRACLMCGTMFRPRYATRLFCCQGCANRRQKPLVETPEKQQARLLAKFNKCVVIKEGSECWGWSSITDYQGYSILRLGTRIQVRAARFSYTAFRGPIPDGMEIDHLCRNRACVNHAHLEAVDHATNLKRRTEAKTHCVNGHEFTPSNVRMNPGRNGRVCKECDRIRARKYKQKAATGE